MTQELQLPVSAVFPAASRTDTKATLTDVGRDRYFLNALRDSAKTEAMTPGVPTPAPEQVTPAAAHAFTTDFPATAPALEKSSHRTLSPPAGNNVSATGSSPSLPHTAISDRAAVAGMALPASVPMISSLSGFSAGRTAPAHRAGDRPAAIWLPQNITLHESADGVDVIARNFFLDDAGRRQLALRILQDLAAAGKSPRQLSLNGDVLWRAETRAPQSASASVRKA